MKKPITLQPDEPKKIERADIAPQEGFSLVVDGRFKTNFPDKVSAEVAAADLLSRYRMLQIEIHDGAKRTRTKFS